MYSSQCEERKKAGVQCRTCVYRQCATEYSEKINKSVEQCCVIKFCVFLKKMPSEMTTLIKEAFGKKMLGDSTIWQGHNAFVDR